MKFIKKRRQLGAQSSFRTTIQRRKDRRKQKRMQKKQNRAMFAARLQGRPPPVSGEQGQNVTKINKLKAAAEAKKLQPKKGKDSQSNKKGVSTNNKTENEKSESEEETEGFKASTSVSDRMARLQEFVNQEAGISQTDGSKKAKQNESSQEKAEESNEGLIKDKKKLKALRREQQEDTKEINKMARLLRLNKPHQKKKVAPIFADDFGGLLRDIEEGSMSNVDKYKNDGSGGEDSEEEFEKDMTIALGLSAKKEEDDSGAVNKKAKKAERGSDASAGKEQKDSSMSDYDRFLNGEFDEDDNAYEDDRYWETYDDEDEYGDMYYDDDIDNAPRRSQANDSRSLANVDTFGYDGAPDESKFSDDDDEEEEEDGGGQSEGGLDESRFSDSDDGTIYNSTFKVSSAEGRGRDYEDHEEEDGELDESRYSNDEEDDQSSFIDSQAEEDEDAEESDNDEELFHDFRDEPEFAFEGGSGFYSKPEILKNGQENDIDRYSSNSEDDQDLEGFVVDDQEVEYEHVSDELPDDELSDSPSPVKKRKRARLILHSDDSDEKQSEKDGESGGTDDDCYFIPQKHKKVSVGSDDEVNMTSLPDSNKKQRKTTKKRKKIQVNTISSDTEENSEKDDGEEKDSPVMQPKKKNKKGSLKKRVTNDSDSSLESKAKKAKVIFDLTNLKDEQNDSSGDDLGDDDNKAEKRVKAIAGRHPPPARAGLKYLPLPDVSTDDTAEEAEQVQVVMEEEEEEDELEEEEEEDELEEEEEEDELEEEEEEDELEEEEEKDELEKEKEEEKLKAGEKEEDGEDQSLGRDKGDSSADFESDSEDPEGKEEELKEDIYGRLRDSKGNIVSREKAGGKQGGGRYIPPAQRKLMALDTSQKKKEQLASLRKMLKGLLNRLSESNLAGIASQVEGMYLKHPKNDVNDLLTGLIIESVVSPTLTPERLVQELAVLVAVLSANVGSEVGAHILNEFVLKWSDEMQLLSPGVEVCSKVMDNLLLFVASLYSFRVVEARLVYDILHRLAEGFTEKEVELILLVLRSVGFSLRRDDPLALKALITKIQTRSTEIRRKSEEEGEEYTRVKFLQEVLLAVRNNNVSKLPNYDPSHAEHLRGAVRGMVRKGTQPAQLNVTLQDLLQARECGRWWVVGSAWAGGLVGERPPPDKDCKEQGQKKGGPLESKFSERFIQRAAKLQLARPPRINILWAVTEGAEDFLDAFEKLLQLGLPRQQEREVFAVIVLCCQKGRIYNPFFAHLANHMCKFDRKYVRLLQFALWDKFEAIESMKAREASNLAKFLTHLIGENSLNLTILKHISLMEVDKQMVSFLRQVLIPLLLHPAGSETINRIFSSLCASPKLRVLCQSLRIFISKFISSKKSEKTASHQMLTKRIQEVSEILSGGRGVRL